ncbi:hypothetical protein EON79_06660 [bacterium]|nr:MAG: hypothetical protein EON79_06660 [bacterium]
MAVFKTGATVGLAAMVAASLLRSFDSAWWLWVFLLPILMGIGSVACLPFRTRWTFHEGAIATLWSLGVLVSSLTVTTLVTIPDLFADAMLFVLAYGFAGIPAGLLGTGVGTVLRNAIHNRLVSE